MLTIGVVIFPGVEELDFVGPYEVVSYINKIKPQSTLVLTVSSTTEPVRAFNGLTVIPDTDYIHCPQLDVLIIPGGKGRVEAMHDLSLREFITKQSLKAKYVTSVCTGAFILAEAGLLKGKRATTHHTAVQELAAYPGIIVEKQKFIHDGNIITAAGVSSGLELGFYLLYLLFGLELSQQVANKIEYEINIGQLV